MGRQRPLSQFVIRLPLDSADGKGDEKIFSSRFSQSSPEDQVVPEEGLEPSQGYPYRILSQIVSETVP